MIFKKIGYKICSNKATDPWFLEEDLEFDLKSIKRNQRSPAQLERFLWPIFEKIDFGGFRKFYPPPKFSARDKKENFDRFPLILAKK